MTRRDLNHLTAPALWRVDEDVISRHANDPLHARVLLLHGYVVGHDVTDPDVPATAVRAVDDSGLADNLKGRQHGGSPGGRVAVAVIKEDVEQGKGLEDPYGRLDGEEGRAAGEPSEESR